MNMSKGFAQILATGVYASIQDKGRVGFEQYGVPLSGYLIPSWLDYDETNAIEFFGAGLTIRFSHHVIVRIYGVGITVAINNEPIENVSIFSINSGDIIKVLKNTGNIGYISISSGWKSEYSMGSYSQMKGITQYDRLQTNMVIGYTSSGMTPELVVLSNSGREEINTTFLVAPGPEYFRFKCQIKQIELIKSPATNRHAVSFENSIIGEFPEITSSYTPIGTIQITKGGKVFILGKDGQTTGGYFRWGFLSEGDLERLYQCEFGKKLIFRIAE
jgi:antagonist of KipI